VLGTLQLLTGRRLKPGHQPKSILIVDDSDSVRFAVRTAIETCTNFRVCGEATHGSEAVTIAQELKPDLVIMDVAMPMMNGVEAASLLKKKLPGLPIVLFTLYADEMNGPLSSFGVTVILSKTDGFVPLLNCLNGLLGSD
jgi:DNA-binding NarL/FixJ family response regulator